MNDRDFWKAVHSGVEQVIAGLTTISKALVRYKLSLRDTDRKDAA